MKLGDTVYSATLTKCLPARFVPFPSAHNPCSHTGCNIREHGASNWICLQAEGNQFQYVLQSNYPRIYESMHSVSFLSIGKLLHVFSSWPLPTESRFSYAPLMICRGFVFQNYNKN
jgi:hypothetical protein